MSANGIMYYKVLANEDFTEPEKYSLMSSVNKALFIKLLIDLGFYNCNNIFFTEGFYFSFFNTCLNRHLSAPKKVPMCLLNNICILSPIDRRKQAYSYKP